MKRKIVVAGTLLSVMFLNSCNKTLQDTSATDVEDNAIGAATPVALWNFDSSMKETMQDLVGVPHNDARFSTTAEAHNGKAAGLSPDSGFVTYDDAGTALPNLTTGLTVDFWVFAYPKEGGAQCIWCLPQTGAFWPTHHVLLDNYNIAKGDTGLIKIMFKANKSIDYNERWTEVGNIPEFYHHWSHIQYAYDGATSELTVKVNGHKYVDHQKQYTDATNTTLLGNLMPNPGTHGIVIGAFQNAWNEKLFGAPEPWMLGTKGRIDRFKIFDTALF